MLCPKSTISLYSIFQFVPPGYKSRPITHNPTLPDPRKYRNALSLESQIPPLPTHREDFTLGASCLQMAIKEFHRKTG